MPQKKCSFCGRGEKDVKLLITGLNGYICEECAQQAYNIVMQTGALAVSYTHLTLPTSDLV